MKVVFPTAGIHPYHVEGCGLLDDAMANIATLAALEQGDQRLRIEKERHSNEVTLILSLWDEFTVAPYGGLARCFNRPRSCSPHMLPKNEEPPFIWINRLSHIVPLPLSWLHSAMQVVKIACPHLPSSPPRPIFCRNATKF